MTQPRVRYGIYTTSDHTYWTAPTPLENVVAANATTAAIAKTALAEVDRALRQTTFRFYDGLEHRAVASAHIVSVRLEILDGDGNVMEQ